MIPLATMALSIASLTMAQVVLRGNIEPEQSSIESVSAAGITLSAEPPRIVSWGQVKRVEGGFADDAQKFMPIADQLWRATARLERGDAPGAAPLFASAFEAQIESRGVSLLHAAEGHAESQRRLGKSAQAVDAWLVALQLQRERVQLSLDGDHHLLHIDGETGLSSGLAPIWAPAAELSQLASADVTISISDPDQVVSAMARLYRRAARFELGLPADDNSPPIEDRIASLPGIALVQKIVIARTGTSSERAEAQASLRRALEQGALAKSPSWVEAWHRVALARSLLIERVPEARDEALLHLAHVPARFASTQPYLAGLALAEMSVEMSRRGANDDAAWLAQEFLRLFPWHPARAWMLSERENLLHNSANAFNKESLSSP